MKVNFYDMPSKERVFMAKKLTILIPNPLFAAAGFSSDDDDGYYAAVESRLKKALPENCRRTPQSAWPILF